MKATFIDRVGNRVNFSMDFSAEEFEAAQVEVYKKTKQKFQVAGFRRGKAPRKLIECHYGQDVFFEEAMNDLITKAYPEAIDELGVEPVDLPSVDFSEVAKGKPVAITVGVTVEPVV
jgi:trigger factor